MGTRGLDTSVPAAYHPLGVRSSIAARTHPAGWFILVQNSRSQGLQPVLLSLPLGPVVCVGLLRLPLRSCRWAVIREVALESLTDLVAGAFWTSGVVVGQYDGDGSASTTALDVHLVDVFVAPERVEKVSDPSIDSLVELEEDADSGTPGPVDVHDRSPDQVLTAWLCALQPVALAHVLYPYVERVESERSCSSLCEICHEDESTFFVLN